MPERDYVWLPRKDILDFEEISTLVDVFTDLGVDRVRLTGGEPLVRRDLPKLIRLLADKPALKDLALTTNGVLLADQAGRLREAGLKRITASLDTCNGTGQALTGSTITPAFSRNRESARAGFRWSRSTRS
jgi:cyclic pyranopterin phosphate synthase